MTGQGETTNIRYEKAYSAGIWDRKYAVTRAREEIVEMWAKRGYHVVEELLTFTVQNHTVPPIESAFGIQPGYSYWTIKAEVGVITPIGAA